MSSGIGTISWVDLTVGNAEEVRDFYQKVVGWHSEEVDFGGYFDYNMIPAGSDTPAAGVCHAVKTMADFPAVWMVYITVADLDQSVADCEKLGGKVIKPPFNSGSGRLCIIQDPAGAYAALYQE
jgi:predicted enzyme related to lactoylglutathione lyase